MCVCASVRACMSCAKLPLINLLFKCHTTLVIYLNCVSDISSSWDDFELTFLVLGRTE